MNRGERFQAHCQICYRVFEADSVEQAVKQVSDHEAGKGCRRPYYDAANGRWVEQPPVKE